jgi:hypothetical protein
VDADAAARGLLALRESELVLVIEKVAELVQACSTPASASRASWRRLMPSWTAWAVVSTPHCPAAMWDARATTFVIMLTLYHSVDTNGVMYPSE